jgi:hypothetical protein
MKIKTIRILEEIIDLELDSLDVLVECENGYTYVVVVTTPAYLADEMAQEKINYIKPQSPIIIVKKLTKQIIEEAILAYAENDAYWLKLCHFGHLIDISVLNQLQEEWDLFELEGLDRLFYYIQKYTGIPVENRVLFEPMIFIILVSSLVYCVLKPEVFNFLNSFNYITN